MIIDIDRERVVEVTRYSLGIKIVTSSVVRNRVVGIKGAIYNTKGSM